MNGRSILDGRVDPTRLHTAVASLRVDVLAMQEVDRGQSRSGNIDLSAVAARRAGRRSHAPVRPRRCRRAGRVVPGRHGRGPRHGRGALRSGAGDAVAGAVVVVDLAAARARARSSVRAGASRRSRSTAAGRAARGSRGDHRGSHRADDRGHHSPVVRARMERTTTAPDPTGPASAACSAVPARRPQPARSAAPARLRLAHARQPTHLPHNPTACAIRSCPAGPTRCGGYSTRSTG